MDRREGLKKRMKEANARGRKTQARLRQERRAKRKLDGKAA